MANLVPNPWVTFFMRQFVEKKRVASKIIKRYDKPKTPYQRLMESEFIEPATKRKLKEQFDSLNPFELRKAMEIKIDKILKTVSKNP